MARKQVQNPLQGGPNIQVTGRPPSVPGSARPAPRIQDNGLMQLAESLSAYQPVLRELIAQKQAEEKEAAVSLGELKAAELSAEQRMAEINSKFKTFVDNGTVPKSMLPFFQTGFSRRTGRELALTELQAALDEGYKATVAVEGRVDPDKFVTDTLKTLREKLPETDIYAHKGFDEVAQQITQNFRNRSNAEYRKNYENAALTKIANEGIDRLQLYVTADIDEKGAALANFRDFFTNLKETELPKSEVAPFIVKNAVSPMVDDLIAREDFDGAEELVEEMERFDVTGEGGLLGNMSTTKGVLAQMKLHISEQRRRADDPDEAFRKKVNAAYFKADADTRLVLADLGDQKLTPALKNQLLQDYQEKNADNPWAVSKFAENLDKAYRDGITQDDPQTFLNIARLAESLRPADLERAASLLETAGNNLSPTSIRKLEEQITRSRTLFGLITDEDARLAERTIYRAEADDISQQVLPAFSTAEGYLSESFTRPMRLYHRQQVMQYYRDTLATLLRSEGFPTVEDAKAALPKLRAQAIQGALSYADQLTTSLLPKEAPQSAQPAQPSSASKTPNNAQKNPKDTSAPDPLGNAITAKETASNDNSRNRAAFLDFFKGGVSPRWKVSDADLWGQFALDMPKEKKLERISQMRPALIYKSVKEDYYSLLKSRERGSDTGDPRYIKMLRDFALNLKTYGGAEYLTPEQLSDLGINPEAFPSAGTKPGLIR